jgi:hypothetical protein
MAGAILSHLTVLGIEVQGDGGYLFFLALLVAVSCITLLVATRYQWVPILTEFISVGKK